MLERLKLQIESWPSFHCGVYCAEIDWTFWLASIIIVWISVWLCSPVWGGSPSLGDVWCDGDTFTWLVVVGSSLQCGACQGQGRSNILTRENTRTHSLWLWLCCQPWWSGCFDVLVTVGTPPSSQWEYYDLFSIPASYYPRCCQYEPTGPNCFESNWHFMKQ